MVSNSNKGQVGLENWRFLSTQEVAKILGVRVETVRNYIKRGKLPAVKKEFMESGRGRGAYDPD